MIIKDYDQMLYDILKSLVTDFEGNLLPEGERVQLYRNSVDTDMNSQSQDYVVYSTGISNTPRIYGDGKVLTRRCSCDITVNEAGNGNSENSGYLVRKVEEILAEKNIPYTKVSLGYIESSDSMQTTFDFYL